METQKHRISTSLILGAIALMVVGYSLGAVTGFNYGRSQEGFKQQQGFRQAVTQLSQQAQPVRKSGTIPQGEYRVGVDIPSGQYKMVSNRVDCIYYVYSSSDQTAENIVDQGVVYGQKYIVLKSGQYFELQNGYFEKAN